MRIMSFNLRMDTPGDKEHAWPNRIPAVRHVLSSYSPRYLGIQEGLPHQVAEVDSWSDAYARVGRGRLADGTGESVAVYYRKERFEHLQSGHFWLSDTPDIPGSATFGNTIPRMVTWVRLKERGGREWLCVNTHLDHVSEPARQQGARMIVEFIAREQGDSLVVVTGDFNALPKSDAVQAMLSAGLVARGSGGGRYGPDISRVQRRRRRPHRLRLCRCSPESEGWRCLPREGAGAFPFGSLSGHRRARVRLSA